MDIATLSGIIVFAGFVFGAVYMQEGIAGFKPFMNAEAFMLVLGGTFCALLVNFPLSSVISVGKVLKKVMLSKGEDTSKLVSTFVTLAQKAKKEGFLALQADVQAITDNDFLKRGVQLVIDGADHEFIRNMLETELDFIRERHKNGREIFNALGTYAPAFGIIGTVLGMILMLSSIDDVAQVPRRMAMALAAAFFGLASGYWLFMPIGGKLKNRSDEELFVKEIIIRGVLLLQSGATPSVVEANLKAYLDPSQRLNVKKEAKPGAPGAEGEAAPGAGTGQAA